MASVIRGLALGGLWGLLWCLVEALRGGAAMLPGALAVVLLFCLLGGAAGASRLSRALRAMPRAVALSVSLGLALIWGGSFFPLRFLLSTNFEPTAELVALCATYVTGLAVIVVLLGLALNRRRRVPADAWAALPVALLALLAAALASLVTPEFPNFAWLTALTAAASAWLFAVAAVIALPGTWLEAPRPTALAAGVAIAAWAAGLLAYGLSDPLRAAAWRDSRLARMLGHCLVAATDLDGDGVSGSLGHPDCDDGSARVFPGAPDFPDSGLDENCQGGGEATGEAVRALWTPPDGARARQQPAELAFERKRYNIVLLTMDATRADHTSLMGYARNTTPYLRQLGEASLVFEHAWSASNHSRVSLYSLFTGRYPSSFHRGEVVIRAKGASLIEQLAAAGYQTECIVDFFPRINHLYAGCQRFDDSMGARAAVLAVGNTSVGSTAEELAALGRLAVDRMARASRPSFLWIHCSEAHSQYMHHPEFDFGDRPIDRYDGEIAYLDRAYSRILSRLMQTGRLADTLVVITGDHGESFGEHGSDTHGHNLYEEQIHVPLVIYLPAMGRPGFKHARIATPIDLTDVTPTLLDAIGLEPGFPMHGESLLPHVLLDRPLRTPEAYSEVRLPYARAQAWRRGSSKLMLDHLVGAAQRFDLARDPLEQTPSPAEPAEVEEFGRWADLHLSFPAPEYEQAAAEQGAAPAP